MFLYKGSFYIPNHNKLTIRQRRTWKLVIAPKKSYDKVAELIQLGDERFVAVKGKLSTMEE